MGGLGLTLNLNWNGLNFLGLHASHSILSPSPFPRAPKRAIANDLSMAAYVGGQAQVFGIRKTWGTGFLAAQRDSMLQTLIP